MDSDGDSDDRRETKNERLDRNWNELLQEMRVMQTGAQLIAGFLLTLPFQAAFNDLDDAQRRLYLGLVVLAGVTTALIMAPIAVHRRLFGRGVKERLVRTAHRLVTVVLTAIGLLIVGITTLVFDVVVDRTAAYVAGGSMLLTVIALLVAVPLVVGRDG